MKKLLVALVAVLGTVLLAGCPGAGVKGRVLNVYGEAETKATMKCWDGAWSLSIDTGKGEQGIERVCVSESTAKKYTVGGVYP